MAGNLSWSGRMIGPRGGRMAEQAGGPIVQTRAGLVPPRRRPGPVPLHSRDEIARVAVHLADTSGDLRMASMRAVAAQLDTGVASLYRYVSTRDELLDL